MSALVFDPIEIRYTGLFADDHLVDASEFGRSITGVGRVGNSLCHLLFFGEVARPKSHKVRFYVRPSKENGLLQEIVAVMNNGTMPLFAPILTAVAKAFVEKAFDATIKAALNRKSDAALAIDKLHDLGVKHIEFSSQVHAGHMQDKAWLQGMVERVVAQDRSSLRELPAPIGHSVRQMQIGAPSVGPLVDEAAAEVLRARDPMAVGDVSSYVVTVEGVFKTNGACRLKILETGKTVSGKIVDPALLSPGNVYTTALDHGLPLRVTAKPTLKAEKVSTLYVIDASLAA
jgi:hypothetical protein